MDQPAQPTETAAEPLRCLRCRRPLLPVVDNGRALDALSALIVGRTRLKCPHCKKERRWEPEPVAASPA